MGGLARGAGNKAQPLFAHQGKASLFCDFWHSNMVIIKRDG
jgi:hypothetical protein